MIVHKTLSVTATSADTSATVALRELTLTTRASTLIVNYDFDNMIVRETTGSRTYRVDFFDVMLVDVVDRVEAVVHDIALRRSFGLVRTALSVNMGL